MKKKFTRGVNVGTSSILVTFVLLCLVTFAALSYLSANSDYRLSRQTADRTTAYYTANAEAERTLHEIQKALATGISPDAEAFDQRMAQLSVAVDRSADPFSLRFNVPVNPQQNLHVCLALSEDGALAITEWKTENADTWVDSTGTVMLNDDSWF